MTSEEMKAVFDAITSWKRENGFWYLKTMEIVRQYDEIQKAQQPRYITLTGNSSLPFRYNSTTKCYEQYVPEAHDA